jgi:septal ring factor EnvC (AmiA/AmiB activator)
LGLLLCLGAAGLVEAQPRSQDGDLQRLVKEMEERETALRELSRQERSITRALGELDESIARMDARAAALDARTVQTERKVVAAESQAARANRELAQAEEVLARRLRAVMRLGPSADVHMMLGARSMRELLWTRHVMRRVAAEDAALVQGVNARRSALLEERQALLTLQKDLAEDRLSLEVARKAAHATRTSRAAALQDVGAQKGAAQHRLDELAGARKRLRDLMEELPPPQAATGFAALKGTMAWPAPGEVDIPFGPRVDEAGVDTMHSGISIVAPLGQKVTAVARGRVVHAGWLRGFGQLLIVDHGEGYHTLLAHLSRVLVAAGDEVAEGDVVAFVGDSESLSGPRLYFELRARGRPVDPLKWLRHAP